MQYDKKPTLVTGVQQQQQPKKAVPRGRLPPLTRTHSNTSSQGPCSDSVDGCANSHSVMSGNTRYVPMHAHGLQTLALDSATAAAAHAPAACRKSAVRAHQRTEDMPAEMQNTGLSAVKCKVAPGGSPERGGVTLTALQLSVYCMLSSRP